MLRLTWAAFQMWDTLLDSESKGEARHHARLGETAASWTSSLKRGHMITVSSNKCLYSTHPLDPSPVSWRSRQGHSSLQGKVKSHISQDGNVVCEGEGGETARPDSTSALYLIPTLSRFSPNTHTWIYEWVPSLEILSWPMSEVSDTSHQVLTQ